VKIRPLGFWASLLFPLLVLFRRGESRLAFTRRKDARRKLLQQRRQDRATEKQLAKEGLIYAETIQNHLARLGAARVPRTGDPLYEKISRRRGRRAPTQFVRFSQIPTSPEVIWLQVMVSRRTIRGHRSMLPQFVTVHDITSEETCIELSHACLRAVTAQSDEFRKGVWYLVHRLESESGLPRMVSFRDLLNEWPEDMSGAPVVLGVEAHRRVRTVSLDEHPHVLVGGSAGSGKSNFLNSIISGLIRYADPKQLQFVMIDLKQLELVYYDNAPHLREPVVEDAARAVQIFQEMFDEMKRRMALMSRKAKKIPEWNSAHPDQQLPRLIVVVDEFTELMLAAEDIGKHKRLEKLVIRIASLGRAVGLHMILCTQRPAASLMSNDIKTNMPLVVSGRVQNNDQSRVIVGTNEAAQIPLIPGRLFFQSGLTTGYIQAPFITKEDINECILMAQGKAAGFITLDHTQADINPSGLVQHAIKNWGGVLDGQQVYDTLKVYGVGQDQVRAFFYELHKAGKVTQSGVEYAIVRDGNGMKLVKYAQEESAPEPAQDTGVPWQVEIIPIAERTLPSPRWLQLPAPEPVPTVKPLAEAIPTEDMARIDYILLSPEGKFIADCIEKTEGYILAGDIHAAYVTYCQKHGYQPMKQKAFGLWMYEQGYERIRVGPSGSRAYNGLKLRPDASNHDTSEEKAPEAAA
jgi:FtsK/SpoIIIE family